MSNPSNPQLEFYVIPVEFIKLVLPYLQGKTTVRPDHKINNATLLASSEHAVSSDSSDDNEQMATEDIRRKRKQRWRDREALVRLQQTSAEVTLKPEATTLKPGLKHEEDYFLIGPHAWAILCSKFGYDYALPRKVIVMPSAESRLGVQVTPELVPLPPSGRFSYEGGASTAAPVVADDTDLSEGGGEHNDLV